MEMLRLNSQNCLTSYFIYQGTRAGQQLAKCETAKARDAVVILQADVSGELVKPLASKGDQEQHR